MKHYRVLIALQLALGLVFAGLGHYFIALWRPVYPLDGYFFYGVAVLCFVLAWRTVRHEKNTVWAALLELWSGAWHEIATALRAAQHGLRQALPYISLRLLLSVAVLFNIAAALVAFVLPALTWLWGLAWAVTIVTLIVFVWPRSIFQRPTHAVAPLTTRTYHEPEIATGARLNPIGLALAIGLLLLGQGMMLVTNNSASAGPVTQLLDGAFQLRLGTSSPLIWPGVGALVIGTVLFAVFTRRAALSDYPLVSSVEVPSSGRRGLWLLLVVLAGIGLWLVALKAIAESAAGEGSIWPWLIAVGVIGACWWQIDRRRGIRLAVHVERREAVLLIVALIAVFAVFAFQIGQIPNSLWGDEGAYYTQARDAAQGVSVPDAFGLGTYAEPAFATIFSSWWLTLFGFSVTAWRLSSAGAAWLAALPLYFLVRATLGKRTAWIALAFYAVSPWVLTYARMGYSATQSIWPVVLALACTWLAVQRDSRFYAFLAGCAAGLSFFVPLTARIAIVLVPAWLVLMWIGRRLSGKTLGRQLAAVVLGVVIAAAPPIVYGMSHAPDTYLGKQFESAFNNTFYARDFYPEDQLTEWYGAIPAGQQELFYAPQVYVPLIGRGAIRTALAFHLPSVVNENYLVGSLADPFGLLYLLGLAWSVARWRRSNYAIWPMWLLLGGLLASGLSAFPPRAALLLPVAPALVTLAALGVTASIDVLVRLIGSVPERVKLAGLIGVTLLLALLGLRTYFIEMPQQFQPDLENAIFWQAQQLPRDADLVLIQPDGLPENFLPWGMSQFDTGVKLHVLQKDTLSAADWNGLCPGVCRVFMAAADRDLAQPVLTQVFGNQQLLEYANADGVPQAYLFMAR